MLFAFSPQVKSQTLHYRCSRMFHPWLLELDFVLHGQGWLALLWKVWVESGWMCWQCWTVFHTDGLQTRNCLRRTRICDQPQRKKTAEGKKREGEVMKYIFRAERFVHNHWSDNKDWLFPMRNAMQIKRNVFKMRKHLHDENTNEWRKSTWIFNLHQRINVKIKKINYIYIYIYVCVCVCVRGGVFTILKYQLIFSLTHIYTHI